MKKRTGASQKDSSSFPLRRESVYALDDAGQRVLVNVKSGQLSLDIANLWNNRRDTSFWIEWQFDRRLTPEVREQIIDVIREEMTPDGATARKLFDDLGLDAINDVDEWEVFLEELQQMVPELVTRVDN